MVSQWFSGWRALLSLFAYTIRAFFPSRQTFLKMYMLHFVRQWVRSDQKSHILRKRLKNRIETQNLHFVWSVMAWYRHSQTPSTSLQPQRMLALSSKRWLGLHQRSSTLWKHILVQQICNATIMMNHNVLVIKYSTTSRNCDFTGFTYPRSQSIALHGGWIVMP